MKQGRIISLDWLKCLAALLIVNSHLGVCYGNYAAFATGGAIGNAVFFFCSGYALGLGRFDRFDNWYKRRIYRIYPSVLSKTLIAPIIVFFTAVFTNTLSSLQCETLLNGGGNSLGDALINGGGWFLKAILLFYAVLYLLRRILNDKISYSFIVLSVVTLIYLFLVFNHRAVDLFSADSKDARIIYFLIMLMGLCLSNNSVQLNHKSSSFFAVVSLVFVVAYYTLLAIARKYQIPYLEILSLAPFFMLMIALVKAFESEKLKKLWMSNWGWPFRFISTHCWEIYLAQLFHVFTYENHFEKVFPFPLNIPMTFLAIFATAYVIKVLSQLIIQLFNKEDFDWMKIIITWN